MVDVRWMQRFHHYEEALAQLQEAVLLAQQRPLSMLEEQGVIQAFEYTHELAWTTLKDFLESRGVQNLYGSRDATRHAFQTGLIEHGETWMEMIKSRNLTSHTYNKSIAKQVVTAVYHTYFPEFKLLEAKLRQLQEEENS